MNEHKERERFQTAVDRRLSGMQDDPWLARRIMASAKGEKPITKKKLSLGLVLVMALVLVVATALAAELVFSQRYSDRRLAQEALLSQYGLTDDMRTALAASSEEKPDGSTTFTYRGIEAAYADQVGVYTVTVKDGKATAVWSHDGEDTSGGVQAKAWGTEQLSMLCSDQYAEVIAALNTSAVPVATPQPPEGFDEWTDEAIEVHTKLQAEQREKSRTDVLAVAKLSLLEAEALAKAAITAEYTLTAEQSAKLYFEDDEFAVDYFFLDEKPVAKMIINLMQAEDGSYVPKDGQYIVTVNLENGVIEDLLYDSGLAANG